MTFNSAAPVSRLAITLFLGTGLAAIAAPRADAQREPAPITYAPQGYQPAGAPTRPHGGQRQPAGGGKRIEFRYPDRPQMVYGAEGVREVEGAAPLAFSSSVSAIAPEKAREYANTLPPKAGTGARGRDPAITTGGFDARATAARLAAQKTPGVPASEAETYSLRGASITPQGGQAYDETGIASWYGPGFHGNPTANGEIFDQEAMTAAHPTLPLPSLVQVVNLDNDREVVLRVNDRGPFVDGRMIDVSRRAAEMLGFEEAGEAKVRVRYLGPAPVAGAPYRSAAQVNSPQPTSPRTVPVDLQQVPARLNRAPQPGQPGHFVQLGSFSEIANAQRLTASLDATLPVDIRQARVRGADYFRVWVGPFVSRSRAESVRAELSTRGIAEGIVLDRPNL